MSTALVHISEVPAQTLCSICVQPGKCCSGFTLNADITFWRETWEVDAKEWAIGRGYPFDPLDIHSSYNDPSTDNREYVIPRWGCPKVTSTGRCSIYAERPALCRTYIPASDGLCCFGSGDRQ